MIAPVAFFGHGSPLNTLEANALPMPGGATVQRSCAHVRCLSSRPATIHDFNAGFKREFFDFDYCAPGATDVVARVQKLLGNDVETDTSWGIDHGAYSVLAHIFPAADIPIVQLSIDRRKTPHEHYRLAKKLTSLRDEGVMILASGNVAHNLELGIRASDAVPFAWATRYETHVQRLLEEHDHAAAIDYRRGGDDARLAIPTPDHYLPFLYALAQQRDRDAIHTIARGISAPLLRRIRSSSALGLSPHY